jgi:sulfur-carrier protein adenylyltransferase/sulfurtransferase
MPTCNDRINELKQYISETDVSTAYTMQQDGAIIIDVRTMAEYEQAHIQDAVYLGRDFLEFKIAEVAPDSETKLILACGGGLRSLFAAESLISLGYNQVYNMQGGFKAWHNSNLPIVAH